MRKSNKAMRFSTERLRLQFSIERLRLGLIASAVLLVLILAVVGGYSHYRRLMNLKRVFDSFKLHGPHETDNFTYSDSLLDHTAYTLHAARVIEHGDGKWTLHDVIVTLHSKGSDDTDKISGADVEYDQKTGVATAPGEVDIEMQAPQSQTPNLHPRPDQRSNVDTQLIHIRTSDLVYVRALGVATTEKQVDIRWSAMQCLARGAEFTPSQSTLHLLADVHMTGDMRGQPFTLSATTANLDRVANVADLAQPVLNSNGRSARADHAIGYFRKDGSLESGQATGSVELTSGSQKITAGRLDATLNASSQPQTAKLTGGVVLIDTNPVRTMHGSAQAADAIFDAHGSPTSVVATGSASATLNDHPGQGPPLNREMHGDTIIATFVPVGHKSAARLSQLHATGNASARGDSLASTSKSQGQLKTTQVAADDLHAMFQESAKNRAQIHQLFGTGHTLLQQDAPLGEHQSSNGDNLQIDFVSTSAPLGESDTTRIASAVQSGHIVIHSRAASKPGSTAAPTVTTADGDRATYDGQADKLTVDGNTHFNDGENSLTASSLVIDQLTGDAEAQGNVLASILNANSPGAASAPPAAKSAAGPETHVLAAQARFIRTGKLAEFRGTDGQPARLWQDASQVQAASLLFDGVHRTLAARPATPGALIHAVFAGQRSSANAAAAQTSPAKTASPANIVRIASQRMDYADLQREATFSGSVHMEGTTGDVAAQRAVVFLTPAGKPDPQHPAAPAKPAPAASAQANPFNGSVDHIVIYGDVQMAQPGRHGSGEELVYTAASDSFVLTGTPQHPPRIVDAQQGNVTGATLLFSNPGSTIVVAGEPASPKAKGTRVRTETEVEQKQK